MAFGTNHSAATRQDKSNAATQRPNISVGLPGNLHVTQCDQYRAPRMRTRENRPYISRRDFSVQRDTPHVIHNVDGTDVAAISHVK